MILGYNAAKASSIPILSHLSCEEKQRVGHLSTSETALIIAGINSIVIFQAKFLQKKETNHRR